MGRWQLMVEVDALGWKAIAMPLWGPKRRDNVLIGGGGMHAAGR